MNMWIKNSSFLKKQFPAFYEKASSTEYSNPNIHITPANDPGNLFIESQQCRCYLHSSYNIEREMQELFSNTGDSEQILIIFGLGMGHCVDYIRSHRIKYRQILVLEPYNNIFRELLKTRSIHDLLSQKDLSMTLFRDPREVIPQIMGQVLSSNKVKVLYHLSYRTVFKEVFEEITRLFSDEKLALGVGAATLNYFLVQWSRNQIKSIAKKSLDASAFYGQFKNVPAIIVSAGPSLENRLEQLKGIGDKALIIAPGTGAKICNRREVKAHMAMAIDSQAATAELVRDSSIKILMGSYRLDEEVDKAFPNQKFRFLISNDYLAQYYHHLQGWPIEIINDFSSVSSSAVHYASKLGCNPIVLVGQDLCYYDNKFHADEEKDSLGDEVKTNWREELDINGNRVFTDPGFMAIRRDMETLSHHNRDKFTLINASEAGLGVPGVENCTLAEIIDRYIAPQSIDVAQTIDGIMAQPTMGKVEDTEVMSFYQHLLDEINKLELINTKKTEELNELYALIQKGWKNNRLGSYVNSIELINQELVSNYFYNLVIYTPISLFLVYYKTAALYHSEPNQADPAAFLFYETQVVEFSSRYMGMLKNLVQEEIKLIGDDSSPREWSM